jgi:hypothetical protein
MKHQTRNRGVSYYIWHFVRQSIKSTPDSLRSHKTKKETISLKWNADQYCLTWKKKRKTAPTKFCLNKKEKHLTLEGKTCFLWETGSKRSKTRSVVFFKPNELSASHAWLPLQNSPFFNDNAASGLSIWWQSTTSRGLLQSSGKEKTNKSQNLHYSKPAHSPCHSFIFFLKKKSYDSSLTSKPFKKCSKVDNLSGMRPFKTLCKVTKKWETREFLF